MKTIIALKPIKELDDIQIEKLIDTYAESFAKDSNWKEYAKCINVVEKQTCEKAYSEKDVLNIVNSKDKTCYGCNQEVLLDSYWKDGSAKNHLIQALEREGFIGIASLVDDVPVGGSWGFSIPKENDDTVRYEDVRILFQEKGMNPDEIFYGCENFVHPMFQNKGIGKIQAVDRLLEAKNAGYKGATMRTINENSAKVFKGAFGEKNLIEVFYDPDPNKKNRLWYYGGMENLRCRK